MIIMFEVKNRGKWPLGIGKKLYPGRDRVIRAMKLQSGRNFLESVPPSCLCTFQSSLMLKHQCSDQGDRWHLQADERIH